MLIVKPRIDRTNLKNIVVRGGKTVKYDVNIKGEPAPTVKWQLVNKEVSIIIFNSKILLASIQFKYIIIRRVKRFEKPKEYFFYFA